MLYKVPKTFYRENFKNKAMTASVYGQTRGSCFCPENVRVC